MPDDLPITGGYSRFYTFNPRARCRLKYPETWIAKSTPISELIERWLFSGGSISVFGFCTLGCDQLEIFPSKEYAKLESSKEDISYVSELKMLVEKSSDRMLPSR